MQIRASRSLAAWRSFAARAVLLAGCPLALWACASGAGSSVPVPTQLAQPSPVATPLPVACPSGGERAGVHFHSGRGDCVPATHLLAYRCSDSLPPVIVRDVGRDEHTYLGGRYGVSIRELPEGAALLGRSGATLVYGVAGDPSWLFVREAGVLSRWLELPRTSPIAPPAAFFLGDSIMLGAEPAVSASLPGWSTSFNAVIGRPSIGGVTTAESIAESPDPPDVVVVELGTNDVDPVSFRSNAVRILTALRRVPLVVWQTAHGPMSSIEEIDRAIRQVVPRSSNTAIADWNAFVPPDALQADGVHPLPDRMGEVARLLHPFLTNWWEASAGRGALSCGPDLGSPSA